MQALVPTSVARPTRRLYFLDALRIAAFGLLVLYHVGMYYVSWGWHVKSPHAGAWLEPWMRLSSPWRLSLLFLLSGVATSLMLWRDGASTALLRARSARLGLPLLLGVALIVPPQAYFEVQQQHGFAGSYREFLTLYFSAYGGFCKPGRGCLVLPTWNHLWFVAYLLVYTVALWALARVWPAWPERAASLLQRALAGARLWWLPVSVLALLRVGLLDRFPPTYALLDDVYQHACYFGLFAVGAVLARINPPVRTEGGVGNALLEGARLGAPWPRIESGRWVSLGLAFAAWFVMLTAPALSDALGGPIIRGATRTAFAAMQWAAVLAALGFAHRHWNRDFAWRRTLTEAVFPVYIVHQTIIILLAMALVPAGLSAGVEAPLLVTATFALSFGCYVVVRRIAWLRPWFGLAPRAASPAPALAQREGAR